MAQHLEVSSRWIRPDGDSGNGIQSVVPKDATVEQLKEERLQDLDLLGRLGNYMRSIGSEEPRVILNGVRMSPSLLERVATRHLQRIEVALASRATEEQVAKVKDRLEDRVEDPAVRQELSDLLTEVQRRQAELDDKLKEVGAAGDREIRKVEVQERRWRMRWGLLQREPVAVLVGALLLVGFSGVIVVAMWTHTVVPEVVVNMVLLILGFFFGQTTSSKTKSGGSD